MFYNKSSSFSTVQYNISAAFIRDPDLATRLCAPTDFYICVDSDCNSTYSNSRLFYKSYIWQYSYGLNYPHVFLNVYLNNQLNVTTFYLMPITYKNFHFKTPEKNTVPFKIEICGYEYWQQANPGSTLNVTLNTVESTFAEKEYDLSALFKLDTDSTAKCNKIHSYTLCTDINCRFRYTNPSLFTIDGHILKVN